MNRLAFKYDYVRVAPDRQIGVNSHPQWELSYVIVGAGTREVGDRKEPISEGEVILIPPGISHVWRFASDVTDRSGCISNISVFFESGTLEGIASVLPELRGCVEKIMSLREAISYSGTARETIVTLLHSMSEMTPEARLPEMLRMLTVLSETGGSRPVGRNNTLSATERRIERIRTFCACNYARDISLDEVACYVGMNKSAFCTFMKRHTGKTFSQYVNEERLQRATERLGHTDENIAEIAFGVGFSNVSYFNRLFKSRFGLSPKVFRLQSNKI